jgi:hypothetical protein
MFSSHANGESINVNTLATFVCMIAFVVYWWLMLILRLRHHSQIHDTSNQWYHLAFHMYRNAFGCCGFRGRRFVMFRGLFGHIVQVQAYETRRLIPDVRLTIVGPRWIVYLGSQFNALWCKITVSLIEDQGRNDCNRTILRDHRTVLFMTPSDRLDSTSRMVTTTLTRVVAFSGQS